MTDELLLLHDLIHERTGLVLYRDADILSFADRIAVPFEQSGCRSYTEYYDALRDAENESEKWTNIIASFSRPASPFNRHEIPTRILAETVVPRLLNENKDGLRIWSAGCSTGEEPLMIAMALSEAGWFDRTRIDIYASDANATSIEHARRGIYREPRSNTLSTHFREKYFTADGEGWQVDPALHARITWSVASLVNESEIAGTAASHVIFCRNVFIYFSDAAIERTLITFRKYMLPGAYLFADQGDYYDSLISGMGIFDRENLEGITIWKNMG